MIAGSAASLRQEPPGMLPSLSFRQPVVEPAPMGASPRCPVQTLGASEPPRSRILVVGIQAVIAQDLQSQLREADYIAVGPATSVADVHALVTRGRIDAAIIDFDGFGAAEI